MNKITVLTCAAVIIASILTPAMAERLRMPFAPEKTIGFHIGPKNPTFDESKFPDIDFYYMPHIRSAHTKPTGTPEAVVNWMEKGGLRMNSLVVFDKRGVVDFVGFLVPGAAIVDTQDLGRINKAGERLDYLVTEGGNSIKDNKKPVDWSHPSDLEGRKFPEFPLVNSKGDETTAAAVIEESGKGGLIIVFTIPYNYKFQEVEEHLEDAGDVLSLLGGIVNIETGSHHTAYLQRIEEDLYGRPSSPMQ